MRTVAAIILSSFFYASIASAQLITVSPTTAAFAPIYGLNSPMSSLDHAYIDRALVLPSKRFEMHARFLHLDGVATGFFGGVNYGVDGKLEVGAETALILDPDVDVNFINLYASYLVLSEGEMTFAPSVVVPMSFEGDFLPYIGVGANLRWEFYERLALLVGQDAIRLQFSGNTGLSIAANAALAFQIDQKTALRVDLKVLEFFIGENSDADAADSLGFSVLHAINKEIDAVVLFSFPDLDATGIWMISGGALFRL